MRGSSLTLVVGCALILGCGARSSIGIPEFAEAADAAMPEVDLPPTEGCVELPPEGQPVSISLSYTARVESADVALLVDVTGSMSDVRQELRAGLAEGLIPALRDAIPDLRLSVASFADYPVSPYGASDDAVFRVLSRSSGDLAQARRGVSALGHGNGGDGPEAWVEALYQVATGAGRGSYIEPVSCPTGSFGALCLQRGRAPIILLFTDAPSHAAPPFSRAYDPSRLGLSPAGYAETIDSLRAVGARVLGLYPGPDVPPEARDGLARVARDTGALGADGEPLVFDLGARGRRLGAAVVQAVAALVDEAPLDVWLSLEDVPGDALDATELVARVRTLGAVPAEGAVDEGDAYSDVRPGTRLRFSLLLDADALVSAERPTRVPLDVVLRTEAGARLDSRRVEIVIPARDGRGCGFLGADATAL